MEGGGDSMLLAGQGTRSSSYPRSVWERLGRTVKEKGGKGNDCFGGPVSKIVTIEAYVNGNQGDYDYVYSHTLELRVLVRRRMLFNGCVNEGPDGSRGCQRG